MSERKKSRGAELHHIFLNRIIIYFLYLDESYQISYLTITITDLIKIHLSSPFFVLVFSLLFSIYFFICTFLNFRYSPTHIIEVTTKEYNIHTHTVT
jgi:hypothetical protein